MKYPVKFLAPAEDHLSLWIESSDFPDDINLELEKCSEKNCFSTTLDLPNGVYNYQFKNEKGEFFSDLLRAPNGGLANISIGAEHNDGIIFDIDKIFIKNNHLVMVIGMDISRWQKAILNVQTIQGMQVIQGKKIFFEGSSEYYMFVLDLPEEESVLAYFDINSYETHHFYGMNGLKDSEWLVEPFEITEHKQAPIENSDIVAIYNITTSKANLEFEKHVSYFEKFPIDCITGAEDDSLLYSKFKKISNTHSYPALTCLLRDIFLETEDFNASLGLLGRFAYEIKHDLASIPFSLSNDSSTFWQLAHRNFSIASRGIAFQLLGSMSPEILFGEEIGLVKSGSERQMLWTRTKWNKNLYQWYQKLLKLRTKHTVLRQGRFRIILQDCAVWGIERYMKGEDSIFIFANHSKNNIVIDLTEIMDHEGSIIELITDHPIKRKKVCTIFGGSVVAFKKNGSNKKSDHPEKDENDDE